MQRHLKNRYYRLFVNRFKYFHKIIIFISLKIIIFIIFKIIIFMFLSAIIVIIYFSHIRYQLLLLNINILKRFHEFYNRSHIYI